MTLRYLRKQCDELRHLKRISTIVSQPCPFPKGHRRQLHWMMWRYELGLPLYLNGDCQEREDVCSSARLRPRKERDRLSARSREVADFVPGFQRLGTGKHRRGEERLR